MEMLGRPDQNESAEYYFTYINQVDGEDPFAVLQAQLHGLPEFFAKISEEKSLHRYAPGKWSIREALSHVSDTERVFATRALWFARGFDTPLPSFDQDRAVTSAEADRLPLSTHIAEFCQVRLATLSLFSNLPESAWLKRGTASGNPFTVRALAFITAGHAAHHLRITREKYL